MILNVVVLFDKLTFDINQNIKIISNKTTTEMIIVRKYHRKIETLEKLSSQTCDV